MDGFLRLFVDVYFWVLIFDFLKYLCIGLNYCDYIEECGNQVFDFLVFFNKQVSCVNGFYDKVVYLKVSQEFDYEGEFGVVIGKCCCGVFVEDVVSVIVGYVICNDVLVCDWQVKVCMMMFGKLFDMYGFFGFWMVMVDEIVDLYDFGVCMMVNGEVCQDFCMDKMVFDCFMQIEILLMVCMFELGDVIFFGILLGVGVVMELFGFLLIGDVVWIEIDGLGYIENEIVGES